MDRVPLGYRLLLIGLLPCIAAVIYIKGQRYDPALIDFKSTALKDAAAPVITPEQTETTAPASESGGPAGFSQVGRARRFTKENLYEHVNGHAEFFISAGFVGLTVAEYSEASSKSDNARFQSEVFDMGSPIQAFGVLADESGESPKPVSVGAMAFKTSGGVNFIKGRFYIKTTALDPKASPVAFAKAVADTIPDERGGVPVFSNFPNLGRVIRTRFIKEGYRGLDFLNNVIEREYSRGDGKIIVALIGSRGQNNRPVMSSFFDYFRKSNVPYEKTGKDGNDAYRVIDKYEGNWLLVPFEDSVFCVYGAEDESVLEHFRKKKG